MASSARAARRFVAEAIEDDSFTGDVDTVLLLVSEVVSNAVRHAGTPFELTVDVGRSEVRVTVVDQDTTRQPRVQEQDPEATSGRGLYIVEQLATRWGSRTIEGKGKAVWFSCS